MISSRIVMPYGRKSEPRHFARDLAKRTQRGSLEGCSMGDNAISNRISGSGIALRINALRESRGKCTLANRAAPRAALDRDHPWGSAGLSERIRAGRGAKTAKLVDLHLRPHAIRSWFSSGGQIFFQLPSISAV